MCGIVATFGKIDHTIHTIFETMLSVGIVRGADSTGIAGIGDKISIVKDTIFPIELLRTKDYQENILKNRNICLIGHNRAATRGTISKNNAHPFKHKHITLVHNGTLLNQIDNKIKSDTDSESICIGIATKGIDEVWKELNGAAAVVYFNENDNSINFITNGERPITWGYSKDLKTAFFASDSWMIRKPVEYNNIKLSKDMIWKPENNELWTLTFDNKKQIIVESSRVLEARKSYSYSGGYNRSYGYGEWGDYEYDENTKGYIKKKDQKVLPFPKKSGKKDDIGGMANIGFLKSQKISPTISKEEFIEIYDNCSGCGEKLEYEAVTIISDDIAYCDGCRMIAEANFLNLGGLVGA